MLILRGEKGVRVGFNRICVCRYVSTFSSDLDERVFLCRQDAETVRRQRSRFVQTLNGDPAASPLGGAHKLGAPYSSHRAPQRVRFRSSLATALLDSLFEHPA